MDLWHLFLSLGGLGGDFGCNCVDFDAIWGAFGTHFGDFCRIRWILENVCFIIVKPCFSGLRKVLGRDFSMLFCESVFLAYFLLTLADFLGSQSIHRVQMDLLWEPSESKFVDI